MISFSGWYFDKQVTHNFIFHYHYRSVLISTVLLPIYYMLMMCFDAFMHIFGMWILFLRYFFWYISLSAYYAISFLFSEYIARLLPTHIDWELYYYNFRNNMEMIYFHIDYCARRRAIQQRPPPAFATLLRWPYYRPSHVSRLALALRAADIITLGTGMLCFRLYQRPPAFLSRRISFSHGFWLLLEYRYNFIAETRRFYFVPKFSLSVSPPLYSATFSRLTRYYCCYYHVLPHIAIIILFRRPWAKYRVRFATLAIPLKFHISLLSLPNIFRSYWLRIW